MNEERTKLIHNTTKDLVADFLKYNRKEDEELPVGQIEEAIKAGETSVEEIVAVFEKALRERLQPCESCGPNPKYELEVYGNGRCTSCGQEVDVSEKSDADTLNKAKKTGQDHLLDCVDYARAGASLIGQRSKR